MLPGDSRQRLVRNKRAESLTHAVLVGQKEQLLFQSPFILRTYSAGRV
jgi:hypothetical protein